MADDDIQNAHEAALAFKETAIALMKGLRPIVARHDKSGGGGAADFSAMFKAAKSADPMATLLQEGLSPSTKFGFAQAWANSMDAEVAVRKFIKSSKAYWSAIESGDPQKEDRAVTHIIDGLDVPGNGAQFLKALYDKKELLSEKEKLAIIDFFKNFIEYARIYEELRKEEARKR